MAHDTLDPDIAVLLARYWAGEADAHEASIAQEWLSHPPNRDRAEKLRAAWDFAGNVSNDRLGTRRFVDAVLKRIETEQTLGVGVQRPHQRPWTRMRYLVWGTACAAVAVIAMIALPGSRSRPVDVFRTITTAATQQAIVPLSDGSQILLSPNTTLRVARFTGHERRVILDGGEAYFTVVAATGAPFVVQSGSVTAQVLGTSFLVRHEVGTQSVRVAVASGKVLVGTARAPNDGLTLGAGRVAELTDSTRAVGSVDEVAPGTERLRDKLVFHDAPVPVVLEALHRWYGYQFRYGDPAIAAKSVTLGVSMQSSSAALATLRQVLNVDLAVVGDTVTMIQAQARHENGTTRVQSHRIFTPSREVGR